MPGWKRCSSGSCARWGNRHERRRSAGLGVGWVGCLHDAVGPVDGPLATGTGHAMTFDEAVEVLEEVCPCSDPLCPDIVHAPLVREAQRVLREAADPEPQQRWWTDDDAPRGWEP